MTENVSGDLRANLEKRMPGICAALDQAISDGRGLEFLAGNLISALTFLDTADRRNEIFASEMLLCGLDPDPELFVAPTTAEAPK